MKISPETSAKDTNVTISHSAADSMAEDRALAEGNHLMALVDSGKLSAADHEVAMKRIGEIIEKYDLRR